jgi:hypothetical protein
VPYVGNAVLRGSGVAQLLIVTNGRGRSLVLHELTGREATLLVVLFPHLTGLDLTYVEDLGGGVLWITARTRTSLLACRGCFGGVPGRGAGVELHPCVR